MGLFSHIIHQITQPVERVLGHTATNVLLPAIPLTHLAVGAFEQGIRSAGKIGATSAKKAPTSPGVNQIHQAAGPAVSGYQPGYNVTYGAPVYQYGGGGGVEQSYQPADYWQGGSPWGYSTQYSQPLTMPSPGYSGRQQDRTWEDLALTGLSLLW